jgi:ParB family chromosome partitioning protein
MAKKMEIVAGDAIKMAGAFEVDPQEIIINADDDMRKFPPAASELDDLIGSICAEGQHQPVLCRRTEENRLRLVVGFQRLRAILAINESGLHIVDGEAVPLRVKVIVEDKDDPAAFLASVAENVQRREASAVDLAYSIDRLMTEFGKSQAEVARLLKCNQSTVSELHTLLNLPVAAQRRVHKGEIGAWAAIELAKLDPGDRRSLMEEMDQDKAAYTITEIRRRRRVQKAEDETMGAGEEMAEEPETAAEESTEGQPEGEPEQETGEPEGQDQAEAAEEQPAKRKRGRPKREEGAVRSRTAKEIRLFWESQAEVGEEEEATDYHKFARDVVKFLDGKLSDGQMANRIIKFHDGKYE